MVLLEYYHQYSQGLFHCHNIQNKQYVLEAGSFQNRVFVWNIMTMEKALVKVHDITQTLMLPIMHSF